MANQTGWLIPVNIDVLSRESGNPEVEGEPDRDGAERLAVPMEREQNLVILRKFDDLNIFNLPCLQAELTQLRSQLSLPGRDDLDTIGQYFRLHHVNMDSLLESDGGSETAELKLVLKIRSVPEQYSQSRGPDEFIESLRC